MHVGCAATLDWSVVGGLICHAGVFAYQLIQNDNAYLDYQECLGK